MPREPAMTSTRPKSPLWLSVSARRHELAHRSAREQIHPRAVETLEHLDRNADVGDDDVAGARFGRRQHERKLGRAERDGGIGFDRCADGLGGVSRQAGWQIDRDDRRCPMR